MANLGRVVAVEGTAVHTLTRRRAAVAAVIGAGGVVQLEVAGPVAGRRALVDVEERLVARCLGAAITYAAGAVATIIRLEVRAGAPGAAVPVIASRPVAGRHARVVGRSSRREPRPQQQNMYNGAGSQAGHGGEYVQLTWLVSG